MPTVKVKSRGKKPAKPYPEFPLYAHAGGVWAKTIRGQTIYFGPWGDPDGALDKYLAERDYLHAGQPLPPTTAGVSLDELVNRFLTAQMNKLNLGEISQRHYNDYHRDGKRILDTLGRNRPVASLQPYDFARLRAAVAKGRNATTATNVIIRQRSIFAWGYDPAGLLERPVNYGGEFRLPSAKARRKALKANGSKMLKPADLRSLLDATAAHPNLHAMILLGLNAALGNTDCAQLRFEHLDVEAGVLKFPRPKTDVDRRAVLWGETIDSLRDVLRRRSEMQNVPDELTDHVFVTRRRMCYVRLNPTGAVIDSIGMQFRHLLDTLGLHRKGLGFYALRHIFRTIADETKDFPAVDLVMGHTASDAQGAPFAVQMADRYRERIGDKRLESVARHVRTWLFD